jgi:hypothetical protein
LAIPVAHEVAVFKLNPLNTSQSLEFVVENAKNKRYNE